MTTVQCSELVNLVLLLASSGRLLQFLELPQLSHAEELLAAWIQTPAMTNLFCPPVPVLNLCGLVVEILRPDMLEDQPTMDALPTLIATHWACLTSTSIALVVSMTILPS